MNPADSTMYAPVFIGDSWADAGWHDWRPALEPRLHPLPQTGDLVELYLSTLQGYITACGVFLCIRETGPWSAQFWVVPPDPGPGDEDGIRRYGAAEVLLYRVLSRFDGAET